MRARIASASTYDETIRLTRLYLEEIERNPPKMKPGESWWEKIEERSKRIPPEELANFPPDGARNLDHYLYGAPKEDEE